MSSHKETPGAPTAFAKLPPQDVLPFPPVPSASIAGRTMQESVYKRRVEPRRLPDDAPNILIVLIDDAGPGLPTTFGGEIIHRPSTESAKEGIAYNRFHTTAMCSPTRASLLTGRNHHRVGNGQIAELANDWDGYAGVIPRSSATVAEVLRTTAIARAPGANGTTRLRKRPPPRAHSTAGRLATASTTFMAFLPARPRTTSRTWFVTRPRLSAPTPEQGYHLSEDLADDAIAWLRQQRAFRAGQAVLHVLGERCHPWPAPHHEGMGRQV